MSEHDGENGKLLFDMDQQERHLSVLKLIYRKEVMCDARLTRDEVLNRVWDEICNDMGSDEAVRWAAQIEFEINNGDHD